MLCGVKSVPLDAVDAALSAVSERKRLRAYKLHPHARFFADGLAGKLLQECSSEYAPLPPLAMSEPQTDLSGRHFCAARCCTGPPILLGHRSSGCHLRPARPARPAWHPFGTGKIRPDGGLQANCRLGLHGLSESSDLGWRQRRGQAPPGLVYSRKRHNSKSFIAYVGTKLGGGGQAWHCS